MNSAKALIFTPCGDKLWTTHKRPTFAIRKMFKTPPVNFYHKEYRIFSKPNLYGHIDFLHFTNLSSNLIQKPDGFVNYLDFKLPHKSRAMTCSSRLSLCPLCLSYKPCWTSWLQFVLWVVLVCHIWDWEECVSSVSKVNTLQGSQINTDLFTL